MISFALILDWLLNEVMTLNGSGESIEFVSSVSIEVSYFPLELTRVRVSTIGTLLPSRWLSSRPIRLVIWSTID